MASSHGNAYALLDRPASPLISEHSGLGALFRWLRWVVALCALVLVIDLLFVVFIWTDGAHHLAEVLAAERQLLGLGSDSSAGRFIDAMVTRSYEWVFVKSGLGDWLATQRSGLLAAVINGLWVLVETAVLGLQLFAMRVAVVVLSVPLFVVVGATAVADGLYGWLMRRTRGGRESGFIYHRAKRAVPAFLLLVWAVYLIPPTPMDPRWIMPPFIAAFAMALRLQVAFFKKHL
ncbi:MAG: DUF4400 domain-containing protein [Woeseia sp.]